MINDSIREIIKLNKIDLQTVEGDRLYYSKTKSIFNLLITLILIHLQVYVFFSMPATANYGAKVGLIFFFCVFVFTLQYPIGRLLLKNPIFIFKRWNVILPRLQ